MKLSDFIRTNIDHILEKWEQFAKEIPCSEKMDSAALRDHAKGILQVIAADIDSIQTRDEQTEKSKGHVIRNKDEKTQAEMHGSARVSEGFSVNEAISEYRALRASVLRLWNDSNTTIPQGANDEIMRFNEAIDQALAESVARYSSEKEQYTRLFDTILSSSPDLSYIFDLEGRFIYANKALSNLYGMTLSEIIGKKFFEFNPPTSSEVQLEFSHVIESKLTHRGEIPYIDASGKKIMYEYIFVPVVDDKGNMEAIAGTARDITERKAIEEQIKKSANYDSLTNLPNRSLFHDRLEQELKHAERSGLPIALFFIDLDDFKIANDQLGHSAGDLLLQQVAERISACVRDSDTVSRLGGDEFTVILTEINKISHIEILAQKILDALAKPFLILQKDIRISASIGITLFPQDATTSENLVRNADQAMYAAKKAGRDRFSFFTSGMRDATWARIKVIDELRMALRRHQFSVYYQPIVDLSAEGIVKAEALLRWHHPQNGLMMPGEFISLAEETGLISEIDNWVLGEAAMHAREWSILLGVSFQISVNKSPVEFMSKTPMSNWRAHLEGLGLAWNSLTVEITEGILLSNSPNVTEKLDGLQKAGIQLSIDDFGTGYASMNYLKKFEVDYLKIDRSFVQDMTTSMHSRTIVEAIIAMAHKLGLKVIAEGVETVQQRDYLKTAECDYAQGYFFSQPLSSQNFEKLLNVNKHNQADPPHP